ncbi:hypothetical protein E2K80_07895 [Rhodophyticola sp. CCM32]|uniref:hypothetical protein n=1 Tax=Rhodophyticola sp. CCM32 TaxID=2916397 RepID=UPI00107F7CA9|nr:hypothetical protein [Rhodophyticola sp. CCM32]QBY00668.1 hypothetical protein E2K80_07895 [Rhodophyticola sp. CCM32]
MLDCHEQNTHSQQGSRVLRVAVCGEVRSGKSALLNALFSTNLLNDNMGQVQRPTIYAEWGEETMVEYYDAMGNSVDVKAAKSRAQSCIAESAKAMFVCPAISRFEFVEVPLSNAEDLSEEHKALVQSSDIFIWVTIASQAWRLTEKSIFDALSASRPKDCILVVSRADKLRRRDDLLKIRDRMERETRRSFQRILFMSNSRQNVEAKGPKNDAWTDSGADALAMELNEIADRIALIRSENEAAVLPNTIPRDSFELTKHMPTEATPVQIGSDGIIFGSCDTANGASCISILGDDAECRRLGEVSRILAASWLQNWSIEEKSETLNVEMVLKTATHSIHIQLRSDGQILFMCAILSGLNHGMAYKRFSELCSSVV